MFLESLVSENTKRYNHLSEVSFKIVLLCNYTYVHLCQRLTGSWKHSCKPFCKRLFSSSFAFVMISVASRERHHFNVDFIPGNRQKLAVARSGEYGGCSSVVTLFFAKKCLAKNDRCAGALSWRRNHLLTLHISGRFLLTASLRRRRLSMYISLFTVAIPVNCTNSCKL